jgi:hypothetical protein
MSLFAKLWKAFIGKKNNAPRAKDANSGTKDNTQLDRWKSAEEREITKPRDPRTKFCVANVGKEVTIKYHGTPRTITPLRVFTKPQFRKTYVEAQENGEYKTFDIDDIGLVRAHGKK